MSPDLTDLIRSFSKNRSCRWLPSRRLTSRGKELEAGGTEGQ